jgi:hypothetical protein
VEKQQTIQVPRQRGGRRTTAGLTEGRRSRQGLTSEDGGGAAEGLRGSEEGMKGAAVARGGGGGGVGAAAMATGSAGARARGAAPSMGEVAGEVRVEISFPFSLSK